jgi:hypothetical protein
MIRTETISPNSLRILVPEKLKVDDFRQIAPQVESIIGQHGKIRLLIDASQFNAGKILRPLKTTLVSSKTIRTALNELQLSLRMIGSVG